MRRLTPVLGLLVLVSSASAQDLERHVRFGQLHGEVLPYETTFDGPVRGGLTITGEKITLDNGNFTATVQKVGHAAFTMTNVSAQGRMPLDDAFFADPITAAVNQLLNGSKMSIGGFKNLAAPPPGVDPLDVEIKNVQIEMNQKAVKGSLKALIFQANFTAKASYDKATKKMTMTLESATMGGIAVPIDLTFYVISQVLNYPFVVLAKPNIIIDLTPFLPNMGKTPVMP